jgi:hypothetical protein
MIRLPKTCYSLVTFLVILLVNFNARGQASTSNYTFSTATNGSLSLDANGNAIDMSTGTTQLVAASVDQTVSSANNIGFNFILMGNLYSQFTAGANGMVGLGSTAFSNTAYSPSGGTTTTPLIAPFAGDLQTGASGKVHFKVIGSAPNRCLVVEFLNMSIYYDATSSDGTFQCRLYETSNVIEFVYGSMTVSRTTGSGVGSISPAIGFVTNSTANNFAFVTISSNSSATTGSFTLNPSSTVGTITNLNSSSDGSRRIYKYTPATSTLAAPTSLTFSSVASTSMVLNWVAASPSTNVSGYVIQRSDDGVNYTTIGSVSGVNTVTYSGSGTTSLQPGTTYQWRVLSIGSEASISVGLDATQATTSGASYFWVGTAVGDWNTAANWNTAADGSGSARTTPATTDVLTIDGDGTIAGASTTISISANESIGALKITNNTVVSLQSSSTTTRTISITGGPGTDLDLPSGCTLNLTNATNAVTIAFSSAANMVGNISGTLTLANNASNILNTTGVSTTLVTVASTGIINNGPLSVVTGSAATLSFASGATYNHLYTTTGGTIPTATYNANSNVVISGYTSTNGPAGLTSSTFGNLTWNCTNQGSNTINLALSSTSVNIAGTLTISSTGTSGTLALATSGTGNTINAGSFAMSAGILNFGTSSGVCTLKVAGTFNQSGGSITETSSGSSNTIEFNGTSSQNVTLGTISNTFTFRVNNNSGINLTGTMPITTGAGLIISSTASDPISGGTITYTGTTTLTYNGTGNQTMTSSVFPSTSGPSNLVINNTGIAPTNRVDMASIGNRTLTGTHTQTAGILTLANNSLTVTSTISGTASATNFIATNGTGELKKVVTTTGTTTFPLGDISGTDEVSPVSINLTAFVGTSSTIGVKVTDSKHPDDASSNDFLTRYWSFTETGATSYTYTATFTYQSGDVTGSNTNMRLFARNASTWTSIGSTPSTTSMSNLTSLTSVAMPLNATDFTGRTFAGVQTYTWNQASDAAFTTASNWTPNRISPDPGDILQFSNGGTYKATGITTETVGKIELSNNTNVTFESAATATITINGGTGDDLAIPSGSSLTIGGPTNSLTIAFVSSTTSQIDGTLEILASRTYNATNATTNVGNGGLIKNAGTVTSSASNLTFGSGAKYQHNFTTTAGTIPTATWNAASTLEIIGYTTNTTAPSGFSQTFGNINWNCTNQTAVAFSLAASTLTSAGTFTMSSTGATTGSFVLSTSTSAGTIVCVNYVHNGGILNFGSSSGNSLIRVSGTLTYNGGTITETGSGTTNAFELNGSSLQSIPTTFTLTNDIGYRINNATGVNIGDGTGTLVLNTSAPIIMVTGALNGTVTYGATGLLVYNGSSAQTATTVEFPSTNGPFSLTVNNSAGLTLPFSRTVGGTLTMTSGNILIGANTLTLGTSVSAIGTLTYTAGFVVPTSGTFARWYGTSGAPTSSGASSRFPLGTSINEGRFVHIFPSSATSFSGGGGVFAVSHTNNIGLTTVGDYTDNTITVNRRSNGFWTITTPIAPTLSSGTISVQAQGTNMISTTTVANLRLTNETASIPGGNSTGSGSSPDFTATKPGITTINDVTANPVYISGNSTNIFGVILSIATGDWGNTSTWNSNTVPTSSDNVIISNTHTVTTAGGTPPYSANNVTINAGGTLTSNANTLTIGTTGGGNKTLTASGILNIGGGTIVVNGNVNVAATGTINQSSGDLTIDGNDGLAASTSVAEGTHLFNITTGATVNCTGGNIQLIDPPFSSTTTSRAVSVSLNTDSKTAFSGTHTFVFGDGTSTTVGNSTNGFIIDNFPGSGRIPLNNVIVNSGNAAGRFVRNTLSTGNGTYIYGTLTINTDCEFRFITNATDDNVIGGNLVNNGTFTQASTSFTFGAIPSTSINTVTSSQTISGNGVFRNATSSPTANFAAMQINNSNSGGIIISTNTALSGTGTGTVSGTLTMTAGVLNVGSNTITVGVSTATPGTLSYTAGQIIGKLKRWKATGTGSLTYNVGSSTDEQRATINFTTGPTTGGSITGEFISSAPGGTQPALTEGAINIDRAAGTGYWNFSTGDGFVLGSGVYTGTFIAKNFSGVSDFSKLVTIRRDDASSAWALNGTHVTTTGSNATATLSRTSMSAFGNIGIGGPLADNPLPIQLVSFSGLAKKEFNLLNWITASEINADYFIVEKLNAQQEFISIGKVNAVGNSRELNQYQFIDANFNKNNPVEYYRLKLVDIDNSFTYSDIISIKQTNKLKLDVDVYPNPSTEFINIVLASSEEENEVRVIDMFGKIIYSTTSNSNNILKVDISTLATGIYHIQVINNNANISKQFMKY